MARRKHSDNRFSPEVRLEIDLLRQQKQRDSTRAASGTDSPDAQVDAHPLDMVRTLMLEILSGCDGWLRAVPSEDGATYWKWKFTSARWPNHYVMYVQYPFEPMVHALYGLADKVAAVRSGEEKPVKDRYHK